MTLKQTADSWAVSASIASLNVQVYFLKNGFLCIFSSKLVGSKVVVTNRHVARRGGVSQLDGPRARSA